MTRAWAAGLGNVQVRLSGSLGHCVQAAAKPLIPLVVPRYSRMTFSPDDPVLLTPREMADVDRFAVEAGLASLRLMEQAGRAVALAVERAAPKGGVIVVLCGPGNNGGDGFVAARFLAAWGFDVRVGCLVPVSALNGDAAEMARRWSGGVAPMDPALLIGADVVVDALFGAGLSRPLDGAAAAMVSAMGNGSAPVIAVDVPSGLDGETGAFLGPAFKAEETVTFVRAKPGHLLLPGRIACGRLVVADIGIGDDIVARSPARQYLNSPALWRATLPDVALDAHKYTRGHAVVVSGPAETTGAARLGARGALRIGAGLVTIASPRAAFPVNAAHSTAVMVRPFTVPNGLADILADGRRNAVLIGPGGGVGQEMRAMVEIVLASGAHTVLDADALTTFAGDASVLGRLVTSRADRAVILTPHDGEFRRLFPDVSGSRLQRARTAAERCGAVVVLKGPDTVIAEPSGRAAINANAPPWLATAGSGDVLAGFITGFLAQHMSGFEAACAAVWMHGAAAAAFGPGLIAEDLPEQLPGVLKALAASSRCG